MNAALQRADEAIRHAALAVACEIEMRRAQSRVIRAAPADRAALRRLVDGFKNGAAYHRARANRAVDAMAGVRR